MKGKANKAKLKNLSRSTSRGSHHALALALDETKEDTEAFAVVLPARVSMAGLRTSVNLVCVEKKLAAQFGVRTLLQMRNPKSGFSRHLAKRGQATFTGAPIRSQTCAFRLIHPKKVHATVSQLCSVRWVQTMVAWERLS